MLEAAVPVANVRRGAASLPWPESLALAQEIAARASADGCPRDLTAFLLTPAGTIDTVQTPADEAQDSNAAQEPDVGRGSDVARGSNVAQASSLAIPTLAAFLDDLLPKPGEAVEPRVPAALRYALIRARGEVVAPPFQSLEEFSNSLARFEQGDRHELLKRLSARVTRRAEAPARGAVRTRPEAAAPSPATARPRPEARAGSSEAAAVVAPRAERPPAHQPDAPTESPVRWDELPLDAPVATGLVADASPRRRATPANAPAKHSGAPAVVARPRRRKAGPVLMAVAVLSILLAALVVAAAIVVTLDTRNAQPSSSASSQQTQPAELSASKDAQDATAPDGQAPRGTTGTTTAVEGDQPPAPLLPDPGRAGEMVEALDVGNRPVFSPSFAADGSAVFFDQNDAAGGSALKEARTGSGGRVVQVLSVIADGARNYHPRLSPDGSQVAFDSDRDGVRGVYLSDRAGRNIRRVSGEGYAAVPTWSPDGTRLAFIKAEPDNPRVWNIWMLRLAAGEAVRVTSYRYGQPWGASWLPDGRRICYSHEDRLNVLDLDSGESRTYSSPRKGALLRTPAVSPDGRWVVFQLHGDGAWMLDLRNGRMRKVLDDPTAEEFAWSPDGARVAFHSRRARQWGIWVLAQ